MNTQERLDFFRELIQLSYDLSLQSYDAEVFLNSSEMPQGITENDDDMLMIHILKEPIQRHAESGFRRPLFLDDHIGLIWIAAFEYEQDLLRRIHILGPAYSGRNSFQTIKKELDERELSVPTRAKVFQYFEHFPIVPTNQLYQYAVMLHYAITGERITNHDIRFTQKASRKASTSEVDLITQEHRGIWMAEQEFVKMLREGNPGYPEALARSSRLSNGPRFDIGDSLRHTKSTAIVLLTLCSRAAMEGGLSPSVAYTLNDYYMQMIEECKNTAEASAACSTMLEDYVQRVRAEKEKSDVSGQIRTICDYICIHIREKLSISDLAKQAGYTEYYFSHKFKKETGCSVADYIMREKLRQARLLLSGTNMSIQEISDELSFGSRSYFSSSFQKETGLSPKEYRSRNKKS